MNHLPTKNAKWADKPGSVEGRQFILDDCHQSPLARNPNARKSGRVAFLFALAPDGVYQARPLPSCWCAFTAPFQLFSECSGSFPFCGTFRQVALPSR